MNANTRISVPLPVVLVLVILVAALGAVGGGATAAKMITSKQIKNNTVSTKDIRNGSLKLQDIKAAEAAKLHGTNGTNGANGHSSYEPLPPGTVVTGGGLLSGHAAAVGAELRSYTDLPFLASPRLKDFGAGQNLFAQPNGAMAPGNESASLCQGDFLSPEPAPGILCIYVNSTTSVTAGSVELVAGVSDSGAAADDHGFHLTALASGIGQVRIAYVWAYRAP